jgi:hypothetical protein
MLIAGLVALALDILALVYVILYLVSRVLPGASGSVRLPSGHSDVL